MQELTRQEQIVLNSIFFLGECRITNIRTFIKLTTPSLFSTKDITIDLPLKLNKLQADGWIMNKEDKFFSCTGKINYAWLKNAVTTFDFCLQLKNHTALQNDFRNYEHISIAQHICVICAAAYFLLDNREQAYGMNDFFYEWQRFCYGSINNDLTITQLALQHLTGYPDFQNDMPNLPNSLLMEILPDSILSALISGSALPEWKSVYKNAPAIQVEEILPALFCAAFLENDRQELAYLIKRYHQTQYLDIGEAFSFMLSGEWKQADMKFTHYLNSFTISGNRQNPQFLMLIILALIPACVAGAATTRFTKWLDVLYTSFYKESLRHIGGHFNALYKSFSGKPLSKSDIDYAFAFPFYRVIGLPVFCMNQKWELPSKAIEESIPLAKQLLEKEQIPLGIYLLNAAGTLLPENDPRRAEFEEITKKYDIVPFFKMSRLLPEWENSLLALEKLIPPEKTEKKKHKEDQHISWMLTSQKDKTHTGRSYEFLTAITPCFLHKNRYGKTDIKGISASKFFRGGYDEYLFPEDQPMKGFPNKSYYDYISDIDPEAISQLENSKSVFLNDAEHPVSLFSEKNTILSKITRNGVELSLKYFPDFIYHNYTIFLDPSEDGICRYCKITDDDKLLSVFKAVGNQYGKINIPQEGWKRLSDLASRMSASIPFSGPISSEAYRDLPQMDASIEFHVQISRDQDEFCFEIRNKPCPEAEWFVKPGHEPEQKCLVTHDRKILLKRDLLLEKKKIREILEKCPSLPETMRSEFSCTADEPEQILNCLAEMKEAGLSLDWNSASPLKISRKLDFSNIRFAQSDGMDWFSIGGELQVSPDNVIQLASLLNALDKRTGRFIELDEHSYIQVTRDLLKKLEILKAAGSIAANRLNIMPAALPMLSAAFESGLPEILQDHILQIKKAFQKKIEIPLNLHGALRPYQEDGFRYLARLADCRIGCCIADDMGLGKTIQLLALLLRESPSGPALVVVPASLCRNWEREAHKFAPTLHTVIISAFDREKIITAAGKGDLLICSYGILSSEEKLFASKKWHTLILDEAQAIKNDSAKRTKATKSLQADIRIVSTGTPVENRLMELWSIFDFLNPGLLGSAKTFDSKFCINGLPRPELKKLVSPLIIRRKKEDVLDDLPPKTEITLSFELPEEERNMYEILRQRALTELQDQELSHITILAHLTKLRRFCCDPSLIWKDHATGTKLQKILELAENLKSAGHRALIFSQYVDFLTIIRKAFDEKGFSCQYLDGTCSQANRMQSVDDFQNGIGDFFLISLKAGGTGLNLTAANYVILTDPWWNPAVENQAADRVHRIGQHDPVTVYRLIAEKTVEERVLELHSRKNKITEDILIDTENSALSISDLMSLFNV